jgi:predicted porin
MKKSIIALAVAGAMTVPMVAQADATLFGSVRYDITDSDAANSSHTDSEINRMRIGVKGEETMDSGLTAGYFIRMQAGTGNASTDTAVSVSKIALYVAGDFGKVILGDADSPVQYAEGRQTMTAVYDGSLEVAGSEFKNGGISYESNVVNGFQFRAGVGDIDGADVNANLANEDSYGIGLAYGNDLVDVAFGFGEEQLGLTTANLGGNKAGTNATDDVTVWGLGGQVKLGAFTVGAAISEKEDYAKYGSLSAKYVIDKLTLAGQYEVRDLEATGAGDLKAVNVSAQYALGGNASVTLGYIDYNDEAETLTTNPQSDELKLRYAISF